MITYRVNPGGESVSTPIGPWYATGPDILTISAAVIPPPGGLEFQAHVAIAGPRGASKGFGNLSVDDLERLAHGILTICKRIRTREEF